MQLTPDELALVCDALDSHIYWELSEEQYRGSGFVESPGAEDDETAEAIRGAEGLLARLQAVLGEAKGNATR